MLMANTQSISANPKHPQRWGRMYNGFRDIHVARLPSAMATQGESPCGLSFKTTPAGTMHTMLMRIGPILRGHFFGGTFPMQRCISPILFGPTRTAL